MITGFGVLIITPDALLIRLVEVDDWTLLFWRGLLSGMTMLVGLMIVYRLDVGRQIRAIGKAGLLYLPTFALGTIFFIIAINHTTVANALFINGTAPVFAALLSRLFLGERISARRWLTIAGALFGIGIIAFGGGLQSRGSLHGDLAAVMSAILLAATFVIARQARSRSLVPATALASLLTALVVLPLAAPASIAPSDGLYLGLMGLGIVPLGLVFLTLGPRYLPAPEVSLLMLLEAVLGPLWVWMMLSETPGSTSLLGGIVVIGVLAASNIHERRLRVGLASPQARIAALYQCHERSSRDTD